MKSLLQKITIYISLIIFGLNISIFSARATTVKEVTDVLSKLTCETEGIHNLLMEPNTHTCIQDSFMTYVVSSLISGGIHTSMMLKLRLDDDKILPGNCLRQNRANPENPNISFGICSNAMMFGYRAYLVGLSMYTAIKGENPFKEIAKMVDSSKYTQMFRNKHDGEWGMFIDLGASFPWIVEERGDRICVSTIGATIIAGNWLHVGCKYIAEPYPESLYAKFYKESPDDSKRRELDSKIPPEMREYLKCSTAGGCAARGQLYSQAPITISGTIMECIREMLVKMLISSKVCVVGNSIEVDSIRQSDSSFYQFQVNMQRAVMAFLTLYLMSVGIKILMGGADNLPQSGELFMHIMKFMLVIYFSVGMNLGGTGPKFDGMISFAFPILLNAGAEVATWVSNATPSGLCRYLPSEYPDGMGYIALWDALDCKVIHYIGIDALMTFWQEANPGDPLGFSIPPYVYLLVPALISKQINLVILCITYPLLVLSLAAYLVNSFAVCLIAISILGILAPVFVPMALFDVTKGYFQSWYTLMISFVLQPVVVVGFMTLMFSLYDMGFYGTCKYQSINVLRTAATGETVKKKIFIIDNNEKHYASEEEYEECHNSIGWILNNPIGAVAGKLASSSGGTIDMRTASMDERKMANYKEEFGSLQGINAVKGFFINYVSLMTESWMMIVNMLICCLIIYLMYELSDQLGEFAADIAQSVTLSGAIAPRSVVNKATDAIKGKGKDSGADDQDNGDEKPSQDGEKSGPSRDPIKPSASSSGGNSPKPTRGGGNA